MFLIPGFLRDTAHTMKGTISTLVVVMNAQLEGVVRLCASI